MDYTLDNISDNLIFYIKSMTNRDFEKRYIDNKTIELRSIRKTDELDNIYYPFHMLNITFYEDERKILVRYIFEHMKENLGMKQKFNMFQIFHNFSLFDIKYTLTKWIDLVESK